MTDDRADTLVGEVLDDGLEPIRRDDRVRVDEDADRASRPANALGHGSALATVLREPHAHERREATAKREQLLPRVVGRSIVDGDDLQPLTRIAGFVTGRDRGVDAFALVEDGYHDRDRRAVPHVGCRPVEETERKPGEDVRRDHDRVAVDQGILEERRHRELLGEPEPPQQRGRVQDAYDLEASNSETYGQRAPVAEWNGLERLVQRREGRGGGDLRAGRPGRGWCCRYSRDGKALQRSHGRRERLVSRRGAERTWPGLAGLVSGDLRGGAWSCTGCLGAARRRDAAWPWGLGPRQQHAASPWELRQRRQHAASPWKPGPRPQQAASPWKPERRRQHAASSGEDEPGQHRRHAASPWRPGPRPQQAASPWELRRRRQHAASPQQHAPSPWKPGPRPQQAASPWGLRRAAARGFVWRGRAGAASAARGLVWRERAGAVLARGAETRGRGTYTTPSG